MRIAVVGTGISGLLAARLLHTRHDVTVFEASGRIGGHTHTHDVEWAGRRYAVDTGFIVYNERTYPGFTELLRRLGVATRSSTMSFAVRADRADLEWCGTDLGALFAQKRNLLRPWFWGLLRDVLRFARGADAVLAAGDERTTLGELLRREGYGRAFVEHYIVPMGAAIWSARPEAMLEFPALTFVRFFHNHGMLQVSGRPQWRTVAGGSQRYVEPLVAPLGLRIHTRSPVRSVRRLHPDEGGGVELIIAGVGTMPFDAVVLATHADQSLALLADPSPAERQVLGAIPYQQNEAVLHVDERFLPRRARARAAWNYLVPEQPGRRLAVTYDMNALQGLQAPVRFQVTLNPPEPPDALKVLARMDYHHPVFTADGIAAQRRRDEIDGVRGTYYCGAWWGYGFHEDGVQSALVVARRLGIEGLSVLGEACPAAADGGAEQDDPERAPPGRGRADDPMETAA